MTTSLTTARVTPAPLSGTTQERFDAALALNKIAREKRRAAKAAARAKARAAQKARAEKFNALSEDEQQVIVDCLEGINADATHAADNFISELEDDVRSKLYEAVDKYGRDIIIAAYELGVSDNVSTDGTLHLKQLVDEGGFDTKANEGLPTGRIIALEDDRALVEVEESKEQRWFPIDKSHRGQNVIGWKGIKVGSLLSLSPDLSQVTIIW